MLTCSKVCNPTLQHVHCLVMTDVLLCTCTGQLTLHKVDAAKKNSAFMPCLRNNSSYGYQAMACNTKFLTQGSATKASISAQAQAQHAQLSNVVTAVTL